MDLFSDYRERRSDSPLVERVQQARVASTGSTIRPAEVHWHMVLARYRGEARLVLAGPLTSSGVVSVPQGAELLWIKLKLGAFMPHLPARHMLDTETTLPGAASNSFWLYGSAWQFPDYENVDTFVNRLVDEAGYYDQPHLTRSLRHWIGHTPAQILSARAMAEIAV